MEFQIFVGFFFFFFFFFFVLISGGQDPQTEVRTRAVTACLSYIWAHRDSN